MPKEAKPIQVDPSTSRRRGSSSIPATTTNPVPSGVGAIGMGELGMGPKMSSRLLQPSPVRKPNKEGDPHFCATPSRHKALWVSHAA